MEIPTNLPDNIQEPTSISSAAPAGFGSVLDTSTIDSDTQAVIDLAKSSVNDLGSFASGADSEKLAEALFDTLPEAGSEEAGDLDLVMTMLSELGQDTASSAGFEMPEVLIVREGDSANSLPDGVLGAFVEGEDGEPGTIMISEDMLDPEKVPDGESLDSVVLEEVGEAVASYVSDFLEEIDSDLSVAADVDIGDRIQTVVDGGDVADVSDDAAAVEVLVRLNNEERIAKAAAEELISVSGADFGNTASIVTPLVFDGTSGGTPAQVTLSAESAGIDGAYVAADLNEADVNTLTTYLYDTAVDSNGTTTVNGREQVWGSALAVALRSIHGGAVTINEVRDLYRLMNPDDANFNGDIDSFGAMSFSWRQIKSAIEGGVIRFQTDTNGANADAVTGTGDVQYPTVDFGRMESYTDPHDSSVSYSSMGDLIWDRYIENNDIGFELSNYTDPDYFDQLAGLMKDGFQEYFGLTDDSAGEFDSKTFGEVFDDHFDQYATGNPALPLMLRETMIDDFLSGSDPTSVAVWRDWSSEESGYRFGSLQATGLDETRQIQDLGMTTDYTDPSTFNPDTGAEYIDDKIYGLGDSVNLFNNMVYDVTLVGNDFEQYADNATGEISAGSKSLETVITKMETFAEGIDELKEIADFNYPNNEVDKQLYLEQIETQAVNNFVEEIENVPGVDLSAYPNIETYDDVLLIMQEWVSEGINNLAGFIEQVTENIPDIQSAAHTEALMGQVILAGTVILGAGMGLGAVAGIASTASSVVNSAVQNTANAGVTTTGLMQFYDAASKGDIIGTIGAISTQVGYAILQGGAFAYTDNDVPNFSADLAATTGVSFQDLVDGSSSQAFIDASLRYSDANFEFKYMLADVFPGEIKSFTNEVYRTGWDNRLAEREIGSSLADGGSYGEVNDMINAIKSEINILNLDTETTGVRYVMAVPDVSSTAATQGGGGTISYDEGDIVVRAIVQDIVEPGGSVDDIQILETASWNVDDY